ncbi:granulocyte-macrophage colony-stimulating factor receptor subunit alpha isoform X4 [Rhinolophus sinicus]|uniref:granulocyte-macrophage colony-stimulating factor receptor subunit alpha isoform X4 n=2 Tax=Rhinolophus sinicus TaxID=89399 RepID=UPI003D7BCD41
MGCPCGEMSCLWGCGWWLRLQHLPSCGSPMDFLVKAVLLWVLLDPAFLLTQQDEGGAGTAAQNFSCLIYEADFMNCTWAKGRSAPDDVQYFLYLKESKKNPNERECPRYTEDAGTHVGCHFQNLSELAFNTYFLVNGTSQQTAIQFFDTTLSIHKIERYSPPHNITVHCNKSRCLIQWEKPRTRRRTSALDFQFQLDIRTQDNMQPGGNQQVEVSGAVENKYSFLNPQPKARHTVRIRAADARLPQWSEWSQPVAFGSEEREPSPIPVYTLVVVGTLIGSLILGFVLKRILQRYCVCTPIPGIKDTLNENHQTNNQIVWEAMALDAGKSNDEEILTVQEVTAPTATP